MTSPLPASKILGTPVHHATYESALEEAKRLASSPRPTAISACNTHLIALARHVPDFGDVMRQFDMVLPDGYPLVWSLNQQGAELEDRVYGPYFMRYILTHTPAPWKHFFFGGSEECLARLTAAARELQPDIKIAGTLSPPYRKWTEDDNAKYARIIEESGADFIWVALGGERQERWIMQNLHRYKRGTFCAVGDAFVLLSGSRPFAPEWMQKNGLTWLYRLYQEPGRLWMRYIRYNSLFLYYAGRDALLGTPRRKGKLKVGFLGSRGVPARYSGFEVVVENLGRRLVERGHQVTVYNRFPKFPGSRHGYRGMNIITLPTIPTKSLDTIVHTILSAIDALFRRYDIIYLCGVGNSMIGGILKFLGFTVFINVDGADFRRAKWGTFARWWLHLSEMAAGHCAHRLIADNQEIVKRYQKEYGITPVYLSYGSILRDEKIRKGELERWGLEPGKYILFVSRLTPENAADLLLQAYSRWKGDLKLVICGSAPYEPRYYEELRNLADERVIFTGSRFGDAYIELSQHAAFFVMPAAIEATRLVLLDQMGMGSAILYREFAATKEVLGDTAEAFSAENPVESLTEKIAYLAEHPERCRELGHATRQRAEATFDWEAVTNHYEEMFREARVASGKVPA